MKSFVTLLSLPVGFSLVLSATVASAATSEEISQVLFSETTQALGIEVSDPQLSESLLADLQFAVDEDIINPDILSEIDEAIDSGRDSDVGDLLDENQAEQEGSWLEKSPELLNAFDLVKYEFHQCRIQSTGGASECARGLGFKLQVASVELALAELETLRASLDGLSGEELEQALVLIEAQEQELAAKLQRAEQKLARLGMNQEGSSDLEAALSNARDAGVSSDQAPARDSRSNQGNNTSGNGNQGGGNQGTGNSGNDNSGKDKPGRENSGKGNQGNADRGGRGNG
jgi:hypothetical protein